MDALMSTIDLSLIVCLCILLLAGGSGRFERRVRTPGASSVAGARAVGRHALHMHSLH
jgi:hypothetical protein